MDLELVNLSTEITYISIKVDEDWPVSVIDSVSFIQTNCELECCVVFLFVRFEGHSVTQVVALMWWLCSIGSPF